MARPSFLDNHVVAVGLLVLPKTTGQTGMALASLVTLTLL